MKIPKFKKNNNGYFFRIRITDSNGNQIQKRYSGFKTKGEAKDAYLRLRLESNQGTFFEPSQESFSNFMIEWFNTTYKGTVAETTASTRWYSIRKHILPYFNDTPIGKISTRKLDQFYHDKLDEGLSPKTVRDFHNLLRKSLTQSLKWALIKENPAINATPPKTENKEVKVWTEEQTKQFLKVIKGEKTEAFYVLCIFTGMRRGEILGLQWNDIDFENSKIQIKRSLARITGKGPILKDVKTAKSKRLISVSPYVIDVLKKHKKNQQEWINQLKDGYYDQDMVFAAYNGNFKDPDNILREFKRYIQKADVPSCTIHDLRHLHATLLLRYKVNPKVVSERLGHSRVGITLDIYSHVTSDLQDEAALRLEESFFNKT